MSLDNTTLVEVKGTIYYVKVAQNSFLHFPRGTFWWVIITTLYQLMLQSWHQKTTQSLVALNPSRWSFLNFAKSCILSCWLQFDNKKWGSPSSFLSYTRSKLKWRVFLAGHIVAMVTYCAIKLTATYSLMIVQFVDTMMLVSTSIGWL